MKKTFFCMLIITGLILGFLTGCDAIDFVLNNVELCSVINCAAAGYVDVTGPPNPLAPTSPDYDTDPTCTLPGMCGPSPYYPFSTTKTVN